jgi:DNA-binding CsgD family transcriptional regulator
LHVATGDLPGVASTLELLAAMSSDDAAARLYGAAHAMRDDMGYRWARPQHSFVDTPGWDAGLALSIEDAVAYAQRGRGARKRPASGWASLTPTEIQVVELVAEGLTNAQIAERMFIAVGTTKTHIAHVFTKLGVTTRAELAVMATKRQGDS